MNFKEIIKTEAFLLLVLFALSFFLFTFQLGSASLFETDEYIYTQISREIIQTHDWVTLHLLKAPWFIHPPGYMWLTAIVGACFGFNEVTARIICALFGIIAVLATYFLGREMLGRRTGFFSGIILATSIQFLVQCRLAIFDPPLAAFMVLAVLFFYMGFKRGNKNLYMVSAVMMALGTLMKGPIALLLPLFIIIVYLAVVKKLIEVLTRSGWHILGAIIIYLLIAAPWFIAETMLYGQAFTSQVFGYYTINRYFGIVESHTGPIWGYLPVIIVGFLPWTILFIPALAHAYRRWSSEIKFSLLWVFLGFVFFSLAKTKLPGYILSLYPFMSIVTGYYVADKIDRSRAVKTIFYASLVLFALMFCGLIYYLTPLVEAQKPMKPLAMEINKTAKPGDMVLGYKIGSPMGFDFYTEPPTIWVDDMFKFIKLIKLKGYEFVLMPETDLGLFGGVLSNSGYKQIKSQAGVVLLSK